MIPYEEFLRAKVKLAESWGYDVPHPECRELAAAWDQGYKHAEYNERHGLQHLHLPNKVI